MKIRTNVRAGLRAVDDGYDRCGGVVTNRCAPVPRCGGSTIYAF